MGETAQMYLAEIWSFVQTFSGDVAVIAVLVAIFFGYTFRYGKESIITLILALYIALLAFIYFPFKEQFLLFTQTETQQFISSAIIFGAFTIVSYLAVAPLLRHRYAAQTRRRWFEILLLSAATTALLIAFSYHVLPITSVYTFGKPIAELFAPSQFFFWWLALPAAVLFYVSRR